MPNKFRRLGGPVLATPRILAAAWRRIATLGSTLKHWLTLRALGRGTRIRPGVRFSEPAQVSIGERCLIWQGVSASADGDASLLFIDDDVQINRSVHLDHTGEISIGKNTLISEETVIYTHDHGLDPHSLPEVFSMKIGRNVWIGMRCIVLGQCCSIGDAAVVGAGSVVTSDVPAGAIVAGSPARIIGWRPGYEPERGSEPELATDR